MQNDLITIPTIEDVSRRTFISGALASALLLACGDGEENEDSSSTPEASGPWTQVDDRGRTVSLPEPPKRIVTLTSVGAALWDYGVRPVAIWGLLKSADGRRSPELGKIEVESTTVLGETYADLDIEKLLAVQPDLLICPTFDGTTLWPISEEKLPQLAQIVPTFAVKTGGGASGASVIDRFARLAAALGSDPQEAKTVAAKKRFEDARSALAKAIAEKPGLTALALTANQTQVWIGNARGASDLVDFREAGLDLVQAEGTVSQQISWEQLGNYPADLLLLDGRGGAWQGADQLMAQPTFARYPAVVAGQIANWRYTNVYAYEPYAEMLEELTASIRKARPDVV
jgi:iron complex transport system substrate-binding protein